jgi:hypothetical protein
LDAFTRARRVSEHTRLRCTGFSKRKRKKCQGKCISGNELAAGGIIGFEPMRAKPTTTQIRLRRFVESLSISLTPNVSIGGGLGMDLLSVIRLDGSQFREQKQSERDFGNAVVAADRPCQSQCTDPSRFSRRLSFCSRERIELSGKKVWLLAIR